MRKLRMKLRSICFTASVVYHYENRPARALRGGGAGEHTFEYEYIFICIFS